MAACFIKVDRNRHDLKHGFQRGFLSEGHQGMTFEQKITYHGLYSILVFIKNRIQNIHYN